MLRVRRTYRKCVVRVEHRMYYKMGHDSLVLIGAGYYHRNWQQWTDNCTIRMFNLCLQIVIIQVIRCVVRQVVTDMLEESASSVFYHEDGSNRFYRNVGSLRTTLYVVTTQKTTIFSPIAVKASNLINVSHLVGLQV